LDLRFDGSDDCARCIVADLHLRTAPPPPIDKRKRDESARLGSDVELTDGRIENGGRRVVVHG
jgi:hypothetical protein